MAFPPGHPFSSYAPPRRVSRTTVAPRSRERFGSAVTRPQCRRPVNHRARSEARHSSTAGRFAPKHAWRRGTVARAEALRHTSAAGLSIVRPRSRPVERRFRRCVPRQRRRLRSCRGLSHGESLIHKHIASCASLLRGFTMTPGIGRRAGTRRGCLIAEVPTSSRDPRCSSAAVAAAQVRTSMDGPSPPTTSTWTRTSGVTRISCRPSVAR